MKHIEAIVYTSNAGHTKAYAELLGAELGLPVMELSEAARSVSAPREIIYLGWLMGGIVNGYKKAARRFKVAAVCGVGMSGDDSQKGDILRANAIPEFVPVFCLQGGFEMEKLRGIYRLMMRMMRGTLGKKMAEKPEKTPQELEMLRLLNEGASCVSREKLEPVITWINE